MYTNMAFSEVCRGKRRGLSLGEVSYLAIFSEHQNFLAFPLDGFRFIFSLRDSEETHGDEVLPRSLDDNVTLLFTKLA